MKNEYSRYEVLLLLSAFKMSHPDDLYTVEEAKSFYPSTFKNKVQEAKRFLNNIEDEVQSVDS